MLVIALMISTGCYSQADYAEERATATCDWYDRCDLLRVLTYDDLETCLDLEGPADTGLECPDFDAAEAQDCVEALELADCSDFAEPEACGAVCG